MANWIKMRKSLRHDPRVLVIATKLHQSKPTVIGGLFALWTLADDHGESFPGLTKSILDQEIGIEGFCDALPPDWFCERKGRLCLPNYARHNGSTAKTRAAAAERVARHRTTGCNADVTLDVTPNVTVQALPEERRGEDKQQMQLPRAREDISPAPVPNFRATFLAGYPECPNKGFETEAEHLWASYTDVQRAKCLAARDDLAKAVMAAPKSERRWVWKPFNWMTRFGPDFEGEACRTFDRGAQPEAVSQPFRRPEGYYAPRA